MNKIAAFLFWGFFGSIGVILGGAYLGGQKEKGPRTCLTKVEAMDAAVAFREDLNDKLGQESRKHTGQIFLQADQHIEVTLIFPGMQTENYMVGQDCKVKFA